MKLKKHLFPLIYSILLVAFTVFVVLDTFVIVKVFESVDPPESTYPSLLIPTSPESSSLAVPDSSSDPVDGTDNTFSEESSEEPPVLTEPIITENSYIDNDISIVITEYRILNSTVYVADIKLSSPELLKTAFANDSFGRNIKEKTSVIAEKKGAIFAINGDFYGAREGGYVLRNGRLYRNVAASNQEDLVIYKDGSFEIISEAKISAEYLAESDAQQIFSFGPGLIKDGYVTVKKDAEVSVSSKRGNPRTAIGIIDDLHYVLVVSDGRTIESTGLTLYELALVMKELGATTAYNLDGGGSSTMWFNGRIVNKPTENGSTIVERKVSDIVYIGY